MGFRDFVKDAINAGQEINEKPRTRPGSQPGIDAVNQAAPATADTAFEDVGPILQGKTTARPDRHTSLEDLCDALVPPSNVPDGSHTSLAVSISPNSWSDGANQASAPGIIAIGIFGGAVIYQSVAQLNIGRIRLVIQNVGTGNLFVVFGKAAQYGADTTTKYHIKIAPGQTYFDDSWQGRVDVTSDTGTSISVIEMARAQNVSQ